MKRFVVIISILLFSSNLFAQEESTYRNNLFINGSTILYVGYLNASLELAIDPNSEEISQNFFKLSYGPATIAFSGLYYSASFKYVYVSKVNKTNHSEFGVGITGIFNEAPLKNKERILPSINAGYRYQIPQGRFLFRTGIGFPEGIYVGIGTSF